MLTNPDMLWPWLPFIRFRTMPQRQLDRCLAADSLAVNVPQNVVARAKYTTSTAALGHQGVARFFLDLLVLIASTTNSGRSTN